MNFATDNPFPSAEACNPPSGVSVETEAQKQSAIYAMVCELLKLFPEIDDALAQEKAAEVFASLYRGHDAADEAKVDEVTQWGAGGSPDGEPASDFVQLDWERQEMRELKRLAMRHVSPATVKAITAMDTNLDRIAGKISRLATSRMGLSKLIGVEGVRGNVNANPDLAVDTGMMKVTGAVICTSAIDRDGEIIIPSGISLEGRYRANPVVLWNHGFDDLIPFPIATSAPKGGETTVHISGGVLVSDAWFTSKVRESEQIFSLIDSGIVRGTSIRVESDFSKAYTESNGGESVKVYPTSEMIEWSFVCMGANPETVAKVAKVLSSGHLAGSVILPGLAKSLQRILPQRRLHHVGYQSDTRREPRKFPSM